MPLTTTPRRAPPTRATGPARAPTADTLTRASPAGNACAGECGSTQDSCGDTVDCGPCAPSVLTLASNLTSPGSLAVDASYVYFTTTTSIMKLPLSGGAPQGVTPSQSPANVAVDANNVYWTDTAGVNSVPLAGGTPTLLAAAYSDANNLAVDANNLYFTVWTSTGTVVAVPIEGGPATTLASNQPNPWGVAVHAGTVFWTNAGSVSRELPGTVMSSPAAGGAVTTVVAGELSDGGSAMTDPGPMAVDATSIYWTESLRHAVMKVAYSGGPPVTLATTNTLPGALVVDGTSVYWIEDDTVTTMWLKKVPLAGGPVTTLVTAPEQNYDGRWLAQDATRLYWSNRVEGTIQSLAK